MGSFKDLTGKKFNMLTAIEKVGTKNHNTQWLCICDCGNTTTVGGSALTGGKIKSCGCLRHRESHRKTHGKTDTRLYFIWRNMLTRCYNSNFRDYKHYGGRGITVCDEWKEDFQTFYEWSVANGYDASAERGNFTIDRIDVNGNYEPTNCRWVDIKAQQSNRRNTLMIEYKGVTKPATEWAKEKEIPYKTLHHRMHVLGWDAERALNEPSQQGRRKGH